eukprot:404443_1
MNSRSEDECGLLNTEEEEANNVISVEYIRNKIYPPSTPLPAGKLFAFPARYRYCTNPDGTNGTGQCVLVVCMVALMLIIGGVIFIGDFIETGIGLLSAGFIWILLFSVCFYYKYKEEKWLFYVMIINLDLNRAYFIIGSSTKHWKILSSIPSNMIFALQMSGKTVTGQCKYDELGYVTIKLMNGSDVQFNSKSTNINAAKIFCKVVNEYLMSNREIITKFNNLV